MIAAIAHPTDFSPEGKAAFAHALALALASGAALDLLHVRDPRGDGEWGRFPHVRETLQRWGKVPEGAAAADVSRLTGVSVRKIDIHDDDAVGGLAQFINRDAPDLVVMATHGRAGLNRWLSGSVSATVLEETQVPALLFGPGAQGFVDPASGALKLRRVLVPLAPSPSPEGLGEVLGGLLDGLGAELDYITVGAGQVPPPAPGAVVRRIEGDVIEAILAEAASADLIAMPTEGRHGLRDFLRGSTTEQVVARAPCPVLALPVG